MAEIVEIGICSRGSQGSGKVNLTGVILAAGASSRLGRPKALLTFRGETFLNRLLSHFFSVCGEVIVVVRPDQPLIETNAKELHPKFVVNPKPELGMLSSLQCGLAAISPQAEAVMFSPVDYAPVQRDTIQQIVEAFNGILTLPMYEGKRGHPCILSRQLTKELLELSVTASAKTVIHAHLPDARLVAVKDQRTVEDVDDMAAYQRLLEIEGNVEN